ncbi:MAG: rod shape-determining protein MreD [Gammaproteobacteria bacterium]|nr:rod shape-determining protein MreD [Gammaproteobacteria bacterium]
MKPTFNTRRFLLLLVVALVLTIIPLPTLIDRLRPDWVALLIIFNALYWPRTIGVGVAFLVGILLDVVNAELFGQHALALVVVAAVTLRLYQRIRMFPILQKMITVFILVLIFQFMLFWVEGVIGTPVGGWQRWSPAITSALIWPLIEWARLRWQRRRPNY